MPLSNDAFLEAFLSADQAQREGRLMDAVKGWKAIALEAPDSAQTWHKLGSALFKLQHYDDAEACLRTARSLRPEIFWTNYSLATFLHQTGRWTEAEAHYREAMRGWDHPALRTDLGLLLMGLGQYDEGFALYESRWGLPGAEQPLAELPAWAGEPLAGRRLLIWPEQGFGDQIQFARYAPVLKAMGAEVILVAPPALSSLLTQLPVTVLTQTPSITLPRPDFWVSPASIPRRLGVTPQTIDSGAYLQAPQEARDSWAGHASPRSIGYAWRGKAHHNNDTRRSMQSPNLLLSMLEKTGAPLFDLTEPLGDFSDMAAVIEQLDLVITVDTAVAHLAGALGKPCWVMLPWFGQDWRWMQGRDDSPWYANTRLFRQQRGGEWADVINAVGAELASQGWVTP